MEMAPFRLGCPLGTNDAVAFNQQHLCLSSDGAQEQNGFLIHQTAKLTPDDKIGYPSSLSCLLCWPFNMDCQQSTH